jgi:hypothetical protein
MLEEYDLKSVQDLYAKDVKKLASYDFKTIYNTINRKVDMIKSSVGVFFSNIPAHSNNIQVNIMNMLDELIVKQDNFYENKTELSRIMLQTYGTDIIRNRCKETYWVELLADRINNDKSNDACIITDVRFENEINGLSDFLNDNIILVPIRIERTLHRTKQYNQHVSETELDNYEYWSYIVDNNSDLTNLMDAAEYIIKDLIENEE